MEQDGKRRRRVGDRWQARNALGFTEAQSRCVLLYVAGMPDREIAKAVGLSTSTVRQHLLHARRRHGVHNAQAFVVALLKLGGYDLVEIVEKLGGPFVPPEPAPLEGTEGNGIGGVEGSA